jgi:hypothetical protein
MRRNNPKVQVILEVPRHLMTTMTLCVIVDISYAAPQVHGIVIVALYREYSPGIVFIFSQWRNDLYHV